MDMYDDITSIRISHKVDVSFGSLYEIMKREGYPVEGNVHSYTFTGADGAEYEISYDFKSKPDPDDYGYLWYYLKNGEKIEFDRKHEFGFSFDQVREMTEIELSYEQSKDKTDDNTVSTASVDLDSTYSAEETSSRQESKQESQSETSAATSTYVISMPYISIPEVHIPSFSFSDSSSETVSD